MKYIKKFNESQFSMDFTGKFSPEILAKLEEKREIALKATEKWDHDTYKKTLQRIQDIIDGKEEFSWNNHIDVQGGEAPNNFDIFRDGNPSRIARELKRIIDKYKSQEVEASSRPAAAGWSGTMRSTVGGTISPVVNYTYRSGHYGSDKNILIGVQVGGGIDTETMNKIFQECYEVLYPMDQYNSRDGGVGIFTSVSGTNWTMIGLACSKYSFNKGSAQRLKDILD